MHVLKNAGSMRSSNNLPKARMTVCVVLLTSIVTFVVDSLRYTPYSTMYFAMTPLGSLGGFQLTLTDMYVISS